MSRFALIAAILLACFCGGAVRADDSVQLNEGQALPAPQLIDGGHFGQVRLYEPAEGRSVEGLVLFVSNRQGWNDASEALARHLVDDGQAVLGIDLATYLATLAQGSGDCTWVNTDFEFLSRQVEKYLPFHEFRPPVILGTGAGALVAYAAVTQVLPNTFAGGVGIGFSPVSAFDRKLCLPTESAKPGDAMRYAPVTGHDTPFLFTQAADFPASLGGAHGFAAVMRAARVIEAKADAAAAVDEALRQLPELGPAGSPVSGLPIVELPPQPGAPSPHPLVIFYSGDGGWRDIDSQIGGFLSDDGFSVIGFDSLRYFWREKEPREMASDLDMLIRHYADGARGPGVILAGYSFGADLLPFIVNRMAADTRARVKLISLIGIARHASFEIRLEGILGAENTDGPATLPELMRLKAIPVQCIYGFDESDSVCSEKTLDKIVDRVEISGGHHFDGDYRRVAAAIVSAAKGKVGE